MIVGVPTEVKNREYRVGLVPAGVRELTRRGHKVLVQRGAGIGSGLTDEMYVAAGAEMVDTAEAVWTQSEMIQKVKEPIAQEYALMQEGQIIYTYFHLAAVPELATELLNRKVTAMAYETIELPDGRLPLLHPMSEVAGKMAAQVGARCLEKEAGGKGILMGGVPGVRRAHVAVLGGGVVGMNAARVAQGMGARVSILDINVDRLNYLEDIFMGKVDTVYSDSDTLVETLKWADMVIGAVLVAGARAPTLITRDHLSLLEPSSVLVDVAVDQGGCFETTRPTTHDEPTYVVDGILHYCVANMPGAVSRTSTFALNNVTRPYGLAIAEKGVEQACADDPVLAGGLNTFNGQCTHKAVADSLGLDYVPVSFG